VTRTVAAQPACRELTESRQPQVSEPRTTERPTRSWLLLIGLMTLMLSLVLIAFEVFGLLPPS